MRIASLLPSATEIVALLDRQSELVAISHECDYPESITHLPRATCSLIDSQLTSQQIDEQVRQRLAAGQSLYEVDVEVLQRCRPDLVLTQAQCDVCAVRPEQVRDAIQQNEPLRSTRMLTLAPTNLAETLTDIARVGEAIGAKASAAAAGERLQRRIDAVQEKCERSAAWRPRVACLEWLKPLMAAGNWNPELFRLAGCQYGLAEAGAHSPAIDWDQLTAFDPEVLIIAPCGFDLSRSIREAEQWRLGPRAASLTAVRHNRLYALDGNALLNRSGPRLVDTLETLAALLHPACFPPPSADYAAKLATVTVG